MFNLTHFIAANMGLLFVALLWSAWICIWIERDLLQGFEISAKMQATLLCILGGYVGGVFAIEIVNMFPHNKAVDVATVCWCFYMLWWGGFTTMYVLLTQDDVIFLPEPVGGWDWQRNPGKELC